MTNKNKGGARPKQGAKYQTPQRNISGKGDYKTMLRGLTSKVDSLMKRVPKGTAAAVGGMLGGPSGARIGAGLSAITGYGDYQVKANSVADVATSTDMVPQFKRNDHSVRVCHREFMGDLKVPENPTGFVNKSYTINPANKELFPWLAKMASLYSTYKIHGMVVTYKTMSTNFSTGGPLGTVVMATNYNVNDKPFEDKIQMENAEFAVSCNPSQSLIHALECDPEVTGLNILYVKDPLTNVVGATSDNRFYDFGKLQIATSGLPGKPGASMGEIWVSYDIELIKPVLGGAGTGVDGVCIVSHEDATEAVNSSAVIAKVTTKDTVGTLTDERMIVGPDPTSGSYEILEGQSLLKSVNPNGAIEYVANGSVLNPADSSALRFHKSGRYTVNIHLSAATTSAKYALAALTTPNHVAGLATFGAAKGSFEWVASPISFPYIQTQVTDPNGYTIQWSAIVDVDVISEGSYVELNLPAITTNGNAATLVPLVARTLNVTWAGLGNNSQVSAYTPYKMVKPAGSIFPV